MDIHQLELFLAVMESSSVTRAAEKVHLSPGAISVQIRSLSEELRTELFVRSGKRIVPTPNAFRLAEHARRLLEQFREIVHAFESDSAKDTRPFHFATGATALIRRLGQPLRLVRKRFPQAEIAVTVAATEEIVAGLLDRRFDLGLISLPYPEERLRILPLYDEELLGLRPLPARTRSKTTVVLPPATLAHMPFLLYPKRSNMRSIIDRFFKEAGVSLRVVMEADDTEAIKRLVEAGFGYSILPEFALRGSNAFQTFRVAGGRLVRRQALAMAQTHFPRPLTEAIAKLLQAKLGSTDAA
ncbi:MAG: LysR family transcriptional regulator [Bryobacteraceae bacterium]